MEINDEVGEELQLWYSHLPILNGFPIRHESSSVAVVYSDASQTGFGGYLVSCGHHEVAGHWDNNEKDTSSTMRELLAVKYVLISLITKLVGLTLKWYTDNQNVARIVHIGSRKEHLQKQALQIYHLCATQGVKMEMEWIPRSLNEKSDLLSHVIDHDDWAITDHIFYRLEHLWGPHSINRFADHLNCKLPRFNSKYWVPGSENEDCFVCDWKHDNNYACPPVSLISRTIFNMRNC